MRKSIKNEIDILLRKKTVVLVWLVVCTFVLVNFCRNVAACEGRDVIDMYHPMQLLLLRDGSSNGFLFMQLLPILVVISCGFSYFEDKVSGIETFKIARIGSSNYFFSKITAVFFVAMSIFTIPLLLEVIMNMAAFPMEAAGDTGNSSMYEPNMVHMIRESLFSGIYLINPYLHAVFSILIFGAWTGMLAAFVVAVSFLPVIKFRLLLFLPLYILVQLLAVIQQMGLVSADTYYGFYFQILSGAKLSESGYLGAMGIMLVIITGMTFWKSRKDCRNG